MSLFKSHTAVAHPDHTASITWLDGANAVVDFVVIIDRGGWFTPLREGAYFAETMIILAAGAELTWPAEIDYNSARWISRMVCQRQISHHP